MKGKVSSQIPLRRSLQMKFAASYIALILAVLVLLNLYPVYTSQNLVFKSKQTALQSQTTMISSTISALEVLTTEGVTQVMDMLDESGVTRILITDASGLILYDTAQDTNELKYALLEEIVYALDGKDIFVSSYEDGAFRSAAATAVMYRNETIGAVYVYEYDREQGSIITGLQNNLLRISLIVLFAAALLSIFLSKTLTRRISKLINAISRLQEGEYSTKVAISGNDELSALADAFNDLSERLKTTDAVRKRFVSDASHELKTPLASIKLLTDSIIQIQDMDIETIREFVQDIGNEADRLNRITEKLLILTRMDNNVAVEKDTILISDVVTETLHLLNPLAAARNITIHVSLVDKAYVKITKDELYQVLFNLVENAIKYNVDNGMIWITSKIEDNWVIVDISDTGIGIPVSERDKIFDRFYRVDKARSREAGGTGLGLSIVQDTLRANGGNIEVYSREQGGTKFIAKLPFVLCEDGDQE